MKTYDSIIVTNESGNILKSWIGETKHAELAFDNMIFELQNEDIDEFKNEIDYSFKYVKVKKYLRSIKKDIFWSEELEINVVY